MSKIYKNHKQFLHNCEIKLWLKFSKRKEKKKKLRKKIIKVTIYSLCEFVELISGKIRNEDEYWYVQKLCTSL